MQIQNLAGRLTSTRRGAILLGIVAALIAAILLGVYITHYRSSVKASTAVPPSVLVAKSLIPRGTTGTAIGTRLLYRLTTVTTDQLKPGALSDPGLLNSKIASTDIFPGQQLTAGDFTDSGTAGAGGASSGTAISLTGSQRAVTITIDALNGSIAILQAGDHVDIYQQITSPKGTIVKLFRPDVTILRSPDQTAGASGPSTVVLQVPTRDVADVLFASRHTELWFVPRPSVKPAPTVSETASTSSMLTYSHTH
jgi:Flp pilus assembly protein CpaB